MLGKFELVEEIQNEDGSWTLVFDVDDEFKEWFKKSQGLKRWSHSRFQNVIHAAIIAAIEQEILFDSLSNRINDENNKSQDDLSDDP